VTWKYSYTLIYYWRATQYSYSAACCFYWRLSRLIGRASWHQTYHICYML